MDGWIDRSQALARLGVQPQTLYAYVSRGRIAQCADPRDSRRSLYSAGDVDALAQRRKRGRRTSAIAASTVAWGEPAISTTISTILHGRLVYRGHDVEELSESATMEDVAALLWGAQTPAAFSSRSTEPPDDERDMLAALARRVASSPAGLNRTPALLRADAAEVVGVLATAAGADDFVAPVHVRLARGWCVADHGADLLRRALVLVADHELNASTFATRVVASTGASLAASMLAGLAALSGPRHGGAATELDRLVSTARRIGAEAALAERAKHGAPPGFGHRLYPNGDPRARVLLERLSLDTDLASLLAVATAGGAQPNLDFALLALTRTLGLAPSATYRLFALGRSVGWAAHAMEQLATRTLIRPRARYEGPSC